MKKVLSLFMVLLLAISLFACGNKENKEPTVPTPATPEQVTPTETPTSPVKLTEVEQEMLTIMQNYQQFNNAGFNNWTGPIDLVSSNEDIVLQKDVMVLEVFIMYKENNLTLQTNGQYIQILEDKGYCFDVYLEKKTETSKELVKVTLPIYSVSMEQSYYCKFYEALSEHLEVGLNCQTILVLRDGDTILGWTDSSLIWDEWTHERMTNWVASGEYEY